MKIAVPRERHQGEKRVAASPEAVKKLVALGADVVIEAGAGAGADFPDAAYEDAGAAIAPGEEAALAEADVVFKVRRPQSGAEGTDEVGLMRPGATLVGLLEPLTHPEQVAAYADRGLVAFALELMPRITRAQNMDVLSSQANLGGYKAVLDASVAFGRAMPMMMTAAGTIAPARVLWCWAQASPDCRRSPPRAAWAPSSAPSTYAPPRMRRSRAWVQRSSRCRAPRASWARAPAAMPAR